VTLVFLIVMDIVVQLGGKLVRHGEQSVSAAWETEV
jgi:hypothetical protein